MKHIVSFSGGKDSTAMLLMMLEKDMRVDDIVFADTTLELPEMYDWINFIENHINREIIRVKPKYSFDEWFYGNFTKGINKGKQRGFPLPFGGGCHLRGSFKVNNLSRLQKQGDIIYIGLASDEKPRSERGYYANTTKYRFPLIDLQMTELDCLNYLKEKDLPFPFFNVNRTGCWLCPQQCLGSLKSLWINHPDLWEKLKEYEKDSPHGFRRDYTVEELEQKFIKEKEE